jgi:hypothetical protein
LKTGKHTYTHTEQNAVTKNSRIASSMYLESQNEERERGKKPNKNVENTF